MKGRNNRDVAQRLLVADESTLVLLNPKQDTVGVRRTPDLLFFVCACCETASDRRAAGGAGDFTEEGGRRIRNADDKADDRADDFERAHLDRQLPGDRRLAADAGLEVGRAAIVDLLDHRKGHVARRWVRQKNATVIEPAVHLDLIVVGVLREVVVRRIVVASEAGSNDGEGHADHARERDRIAKDGAEHGIFLPCARVNRD